MLRPLRVALRSLRRSPAFSITSLLSIGIGIGACTSVFAVVNAQLFVALPYEKPEELVEILASQNPESNQRSDYIAPVRMLDWLDDEYRSFESFAGMAHGGFSLEVGSLRTSVSAELVSGSYFRTIGISAIRGRTIDTEDDRPGAAPVALVSERVWRESLSDEEILDRTIRLSGLPYQVVGVIPEKLSDEARVWVAARALPKDRQPLAWRGVARLKDGFGVEQAVLELRQKTAAEVAADSDQYGGFGVAVTSVIERARAGGVEDLWAALAIIGGLFLILVTNLTNLFMVRASSRGPSVAVRAALGGSPWQVGRGLLLEGLLLGLGGGVMGMLIAGWGMDVVRTLSGSYSGFVGPSIDLRVIGFGLGLGLLTALLVGFEPMRHLTSPDLQGLLQRNSSLATLTKRQRRIRMGAVALQVGLSVLLAATTVVAIAQFNYFVTADIGYDSERIVLAHPAEGFDAAERSHRWSVATEAADRLRRRPGVSNAAAWQGVMQEYPPQPQASAIAEGWNDPDAPVPIYAYYRVSSGFFDVLEAPILRGRGFLPEDSGSPELVGILTDYSAELLWPGEDPIGKRLRMGREAPWITIVGVSEHFGAIHSMGRYFTLSNRARRNPFPTATLLLHGDQVPSPFKGWRDYNCLVCPIAVAAKAGDRHAVPGLARDVRTELASLDSRMELFFVGSVRDREMWAWGGNQLDRNRYLVGGGAAAGLLLALLGVLGIVADGVTRRTRELGVRMALGARARHLLWTVTVEGFGTALAGIGIGVALSFAAEGLIVRSLFRIGVADVIASPNDPKALMITGAVVVATATAVSLASARKATKLSPVDALRVE